MVPKTQNPKAIGLFLSALLKLPDSLMNNRSGLVRSMIDRLVALRSSGGAGWSWGYSFPWQGRGVLVPAGAPNLVCTTFVAGALLDVYEQTRDQHCLEMAAGAAEYILKDLYWTEGNKVGFSYPMPGLRGETYNANLLAAALFCRVYKQTAEKRFLEPALRVARQAVKKQNSDGSWFYGEHASQRWIDNFHTGYNLGALRQIGDYADTREFETNIRAGFDFYRTHFLRDDGMVRYFHDRNYPIDIHCVAQSIITLLEFRDLGEENTALAHSVFRWALAHMWDERGFFYYRVLRLCTIRTSYMRWSQAWMLLALAVLLASNTEERQSHTKDSAEVVRSF